MPNADETIVGAHTGGGVGVEGGMEFCKEWLSEGVEETVEDVSDVNFGTPAENAFGSLKLEVAGEEDDWDKDMLFDKLLLHDFFRKASW